MIKAVIFDLGGVVLRIKVEEEFKLLSSILGVPFPRLFRLYREHEDELLVGKLSCAAFSRIVEKELGVKGVGKAWRRAYMESSGVSQRVLGMAMALKRRYAVAFISNARNLDARMDIGKGALGIFSPRIFSCEVGMRKPSREIYNLALRMLGLRPGECVFIDDRPENLREPRKMGMKVILFRGPGQLEGALRKLGVRW